MFMRTFFCKEVVHFTKIHSAGCAFYRLFQSSSVNQGRSIGKILFSKHLFYTNVCLSMCLSAFGDVLQQNYEIAKGDHEKWNQQRTFNMTVAGLTVGILCHNTYRFLDTTFPGVALITVLKKVVIDQAVFSPLCIGLFFVTMGVLEKEDLATLKEEIKQKAGRIYFAEWMIWPPAQVINFYLLSPKYRVLYDNLISLGFDVYTSYVKHEIPLVKVE